MSSDPRLAPWLARLQTYEDPRDGATMCLYDEVVDVLAALLVEQEQWRELAIQALKRLEWTNRGEIWSDVCYWCGGYQRTPAMDQDYYGKVGHKPDCLRQRALVALGFLPAPPHQEPK